MRHIAQAPGILAVLLIGSVASGAQLASDAARAEALKHYSEGVALLANEQYAKAANAFQQALGHEPLLTDAHYGLGQSWMGLRRYEAAIEAFRRCIAAGARLHEIRQDQRVAADRALDQELSALKSNLRLVRAGVLPEGMMTLITQRIDELERTRSEPSPKFVTPATVLLALGSAYFRSGDSDLAFRSWTDAVTVNPQLGEAWNNLAVIYLREARKKDAEGAIAHAERAGYRVSAALKADIRALK
jgi:tetratricopeptide (TPR) repeat protein